MPNQKKYKNSHIKRILRIDLYNKYDIIRLIKNTQLMLNFEAQMLHMYYQTTKKLMYLH